MTISSKLIFTNFGVVYMLKKIFYDLRPKRIKYEILLKKLIFFFLQFLVIFADILNIDFFEILISWVFYKNVFSLKRYLGKFMFKVQM